MNESTKLEPSAEDDDVESYSIRTKSGMWLCHATLSKELLESLLKRDDGTAVIQRKKDGTLKQLK